MAKYNFSSKEDGAFKKLNQKYEQHLNYLDFMKGYLVNKWKVKHIQPSETLKAEKGFDYKCCFNDVTGFIDQYKNTMG